MSELDPQYVKRGFWINEAHGPVMGRTITTDSRSGSIIVALLAILASIAASHLWHLVAFLYHQICSNKELSDGLLRQQQVLLRTLPSPAALLTDHMKLWWSWRRRTKSTLKRLSPQFGLAAFFTICTLAASIFSSYTVESNNIEVLISSPHCGSIKPDSFLTWNSYMTGTKGLLTSILSECYYKNSTGAECRRLISSRLPSSTRRNVQCPFEPSFCQDNVTAVQLDTGKLDVGAVFGVNVRAQDRVYYRKQTTCAVLSLDGRTSTVNISRFPDTFRLSPLEREMLLLNYGPTYHSAMNETFFVSLMSSNLTDRYSVAGTIGFRSELMQESYGMFSPDPGLQRTDADIAFKMVRSSRIAYLNGVVNDPLFSAHQAAGQIPTASPGIGDSIDGYYADFPAGAVACTLQYQYCINSSNESKQECTNLTYLPYDVNAMGFAGASETQRAILEVLRFAGVMFDISNLETVRAESAISDTQFTLPDDQWIREVEGWEYFALAGIQLWVSDHALGPEVRLESPDMAGEIIPPRDAAEQALCTMQKMRKSGGFVNVNVFGLAFIITISCIVTAIDVLLLRFLIFLSRFRKTLAPRIDQWIQDGALQLQRRAYEAVGEGTWSKLDQEIPVTEKGEKLSILPGADTFNANGN